MKQKIENLIPMAFRAVEDKLATNGQVSRQYNGYIASFGASVVQSGMMAALVFNHRAESRSERDRKALMDAIFEVIKSMEKRTINENRLLDYYKTRLVDKRMLKLNIMDAAAAIKLVIRTFKLVEESTVRDNTN
ncbi:MAG: type III-B CRISPR module-associated protein Cmr5 [Bacteroidota bacterium]